jgi:hypothetical protein
MARDPLAPAPRPLAARVLPALALVVLIVGAVRVWPRTVDDAWITFRYARHVAEGLGPVWNPGERVEGYSSPSWTVLSAAGLAAGIDPVPLSKLCGLLVSVGLVLWLWRDLGRAGVPESSRGMLALLLGSSLVLAIWSVAGMETNAYALLAFGGLTFLARAPTTPGALGASSLLAAAALTRPEGLAFWCCGAAVVALGGANERMRRIAAYLGPGLVLVAHEFWRLSYYGASFPNTYYAKTGGGAALWKQGLTGLLGFATDPAHAPWLAAAALGALVGFARGGLDRRRAVVFGGAVLLHLLYVMSVGDDGLRVHRFYVPILAPLAALVAPLVSGRARRFQWGFGIAAIALAAAFSQWELHARIAPSFLRGALDYQQGNVKLGQHLDRTMREQGSWIAVAAAGAISYYSRALTIDMYGLNDSHIARVPFPSAGGRLMKWDNAYVLERAPELIVINRGYFTAGDPLVQRVMQDPGTLVESAMDRDLFTHLARDGRYRLEPIRFDDGSVFFVFRKARD